MQKPPFLYYASRNRKIEIFEPRQESIRDPEEGPVVFATPDKACATAFIVGASDKYVISGRFTNGEGISTPWHYICRDKDWFEQHDAGGAIYWVPSATFTFDTKKGLKDMEWTSKEPVRPMDKEEYESGLQAMLDHGVNVYFVDQKTFDAIKQSDDHGFNIIQTLKPYQS